VTVAALAVAVPVGLSAAAFIAEVAPGIMKDITKSIIEILAGIPSVVYGFFGLALLAPFLQTTL